MKFDPRMEYYYNGEKLTPICNSDNEIQYFIKQNLDTLPLCIFDNSILSYIHDTNEDAYLLKLKENDKVYHVVIKEHGTTDNKEKWIFEECGTGYPLFVSYNNIEYLIPYSKK